MEFWKMNGAGNDFIFLNNFKEHLPVEELPALARKLCERHLSIGADGLMVIDAADGSCGSPADYKMRFYNADGSAGEMCGNGARCVCRYGYENGLAGDTQTIETPAGIVTGQRISANQYRIRLNDPSCVRLDYPVEIDGKQWPCAYVELGNPGIPHAVVPYPGLKEATDEELRCLGRKFRYHPAFPKGANINFYDILEDGTIWERTYERGVEDLTYACGTGTGSLALVLHAQKKTCGTTTRVQMRGGELQIDWDGKDLFLTGPADIVCKGEICQ